MEDEVDSTQLTVRTDSTAEPKMFTFEGIPIRTVAIDDERWVVARDVAKVLGYAKPGNRTAHRSVLERRVHFLGRRLWWGPCLFGLTRR